MNDADIIEAAIVTCLKMGLDVSTRNVQHVTAFVREAAGLPKRSVWGETVRQFLAARSDTLTIRGRYGPDTRSVLNSAISDTLATGPRAPRRAAKEKSKPSLNGKTSNTEANASDKPGKPARPEWVEKLHAAVLALQSRALLDLTVTERFLVARYHAVRFANCSVDEQANLTGARKCVVSLTNLCEYLERRELRVTVTTYFRAAEKFHTRTGGKPWYQPADVKSELVVKATTA